jgi:spore coat protein U-like protein
VRALRACVAVYGLFAAIAASAAPICTVSTVPVAFGAYSPLDGIARDSVGSVAVSCGDAPSSTISYSIALSPGAGTYASRTLVSGAHSLRYNLYLDPARTLVWGDGTGGSSTIGDSYAVVVSPTIRTYPAYGRIPGGQTHAHVGSYGDSIIVTVSF